MQNVVQPLNEQPSRTDADSAPEIRYNQQASAEHRRKFGQVFTPPRLAELMAEWVTYNAPSDLLDPAYGTGILTAACLARVGDLNVTAYEIDPCVIKYARPSMANIEIRNQDFLKYSGSDCYDAVIMNPPYIRHREIEGYENELYRISHEANVAIPKSANLYIYFSVKALSCLRPRGRAAILIPAEWMSANFSKTFKQHILQTGLLRNIITFSNCSNVFDDALTTASVILCEK